MVKLVNYNIWLVIMAAPWRKLYKRKINEEDYELIDDQEKMKNESLEKIQGDKRKSEEKEMEEHPKKKKRKQLHMEIFLTPSTGMTNAQGCTQAVEQGGHQASAPADSETTDCGDTALDLDRLTEGMENNPENVEPNRQSASPKKGQLEDVTPTIYYGEETEQELVNWEEIFYKHLEETRLLEKKREEQIEKKEKKEKSWALLRECKDFLRENDKKWKLETELPMMKRKVEEKNKRLALVKVQKEETLRRLRQEKLNEKWKMIPEFEKKKFLFEEERHRRMELREMKTNIWKKWREKKENTRENVLTLEDKKRRK